jgi:hypothetical protein
LARAVGSGFDAHEHDGGMIRHEGGGVN